MKKSIYTLGFVSLIIALILSAIQFLSFRPSYYKETYYRLQTAETIGISVEDLNAATTQLLDYIRGKEDSLDILVKVDGTMEPMFNQREIDHMVDVKNLFQIVFLVRDVLFVGFVLALLFFVYKKDYRDLYLIKDIMLYGMLGIFFVMSFIGLYAIIDFNSFWIQFHELIFTNDLWLLDPKTDRLIMMVPEEFFSGLVYQILITIASIFAVFFALYGFLLGGIKHVTRRAI